MAARLMTTARLARALRRGEIVLHYQPEISLATGEIVGAEALARWDHPRRGLLPPADWLAGTEATWLVRRFTRYTVAGAIEQCAQWSPRKLIVGVNVSPTALADPTLPGFVEAALRRTGAEPTRVAVELTEAALDVSGTARDVARELTALGLLLKIDDFGIGHSSLERLVSLPIDEIKIDRRFITQLEEDGRERAVVRAAVGLGVDLGLRVIAEGVESSSVLRRIARLGCDTAQGFLISRALPAGEVLRWQPSEELSQALDALRDQQMLERRRIVRRSGDRREPSPAARF